MAQKKRFLTDTGCAPKVAPEFLAKSTVLPKSLAKSMAGVRPGLMDALKGAVASGDAPSAHTFYRAVAGPAAAAKLSGTDSLSALQGWLSRQP